MNSTAKTKQGMIERIIYHNKRWYGFIAGEDARSYYFNAQSWSEPEEPVFGIKVVFEPIETDRGFAAKSVKALKST